MTHEIFLENTSLLLSIIVFVIMLTVGLSQNITHYKAVLHRPRALIYGLFFQLVFLPLVAFAIAQAFALTSYFYAGLLLMALSPCGACSGLFALQMNLNVTLSVLLTVVTSLLAPITLPLGIALFIGDEYALALMQLSVQLFFLVTVPILIGGLLRAKWQQTVVHILPTMKKVSFALLVILLSTAVMRRAGEVGGALGELFAPCLALSLVAFLMPKYLAVGGGLIIKDAKSIGMQVGLQNGSTALAVILLNPSLSLAAIPVALYTIFSFVIAFLLIVPWREKVCGTALKLPA